MTIAYILLYALTAMTLVTVALPLVKSDYWVFRVFEYPRFQKLILASGLFLCWLLLSPWKEYSDMILPGLLLIAIGYLIYKIFPYTSFSKKEMKASKEGQAVKIFSANVWQDNKNYKGFSEMIRKVNPDILLLLETDDGWDEGTKELQASYKHTVKKVLNNTYGMIFCTRLEVIHSEVHYLAEDDIPSLDIILELPNKQQVQLWAVHPKPPLPNEDLRSTAKDKELMKVALRARETKLPVIVLGDLNDVAWSYITELFRKTSELLDPRRGRGFYSTFHAKKWFMRFPLDYIFASTHFSLSSMKRMPPTGSDHFPIYIELKFSNGHQAKQDAPEADHEELKDAKEIATQPVPEEMKTGSATTT